MQISNAQICTAEDKQKRAREAAQEDPAEAYAGRAATAASSETSPSSVDDAAATLADDAPIPVETIKRQLVLEEISRSGEMGGTTHRHALTYRVPHKCCTLST